MPIVQGLARVRAEFSMASEPSLFRRYLEDPNEFWTRKSQEWEAELRVVDTERARLQQLQLSATVTAAKILELAKQAEFLYKSQIPTEQRRLLETLLSNCTFDRGTLCPTYASPFDLLVKGNETGNWRRGWDSNSVTFNRTCNLQIPCCQRCRRCHRCRGALPDFTRRGSRLRSRPPTIPQRFDRSHRDGAHRSVQARPERPRRIDRSSGFATGTMRR
jgi:hypothetical protein